MKKQTLAESLGCKGRLVIGRAVDARNVATFVPTMNARPASPAPKKEKMMATDIEYDEKNAQKLQKIGVLLGLDPNATETEIRTAFEELFAPIAEARKRARRKLSLREIERCKKSGVDVVKYAANRAAMRAHSPAGARR